MHFRVTGGVGSKLAYGFVGGSCDMPVAVRTRAAG
jgi:hypothetical protein